MKSVELFYEPPLEKKNSWKKSPGTQQLILIKFMFFSRLLVFFFLKDVAIFSARKFWQVPTQKMEGSQKMFRKKQITR